MCYMWACYLDTSHNIMYVGTYTCTFIILYSLIATATQNFTTVSVCVPCSDFMLYIRCNWTKQTAWILVHDFMHAIPQLKNDLKDCE